MNTKKKEMSLFSIQQIKKEISTSFKPDKARHSVKRREKAKQRALMRKEEAAEIINSIGGIPKPGESYDVITNGQSNAGGFYEVIADEWGTAEELVIATWIINREYIDMLLRDVQSGRLKSLIFILSNRMSQLTHHTPNFNYLKEEFTKEPAIKLRVANSHAKTYSMTNGNDYITIDGSGNWSKNPRIECYTITNDKSKFDFRKSWMLELINAK